MAVISVIGVLWPWNQYFASPRSSSTHQGAALTRALVGHAGSTISIMAGGGIQPSNVAALVRETGVHEVHASASERVVNAAADSLGLVQASQITDPTTVRALVVALRGIPTTSRS